MIYAILIFLGVFSFYIAFLSGSGRLFGTRHFTSLSIDEAALNILFGVFFAGAGCVLIILSLKNLGVF